MADQTFAVHCGFFDAINSDRVYSADEMNRPYKRVISNGVFATPQGTRSTDLQVTASSGMTIICKAGEGLFGDKWFENPSSIAITVPANTGTVPRIDSILVQVDTRTSGRVGNIVHRTGTPSSNPTPPAINQVDGVVEYRLANIRINAGVSAITQSMITDRRGSSDCPWVTSLIYQVDTSTLYDQWAAAYAEYFEEEKAIWDAWYAQLAEDLDVSMTLDRHTNTVTTTAQTTGYIPIGLEYNHNTDILEVYINGLRAVEGTHYVVVDDTTILVENQLQIGQEVTFVVMRSVISGSATNIMVLLQELESQIAGIAGGTPTVVDSTSDMTDTEKIYILSSDSKWYYYSATAEDWVIGGTYGGVPTDTTLSVSGSAADAKAVGDAIDSIAIEIDDTLSEQGKAADAKAVGDELSQIKEDFTSISETTDNIFDSTKLVGEGITESNGVYTGTGASFASAFGSYADKIPVSAKANTIYTFSAKVRTDASAGTTGTGFKIYGYYSDESSSVLASASNDTTVQALISGLSASGKTLVGIGFSYGSYSGNTWNISELMLNEGVTALPYIQYISAKDIIARQALEGVSDMLNEYGQRIDELYYTDESILPTLLDATKYTSTTGAFDSYISNRAIPGGAVLNHVDILAGNDNDSSAFIYLVDIETSKVIYKKSVVIATGDNHIDLNYTVPSDAYIGFKGTRAKVVNYSADLYPLYTDNALSTDGLYQPASASMNVGDTVTINKINAKAYCFGIQWKYTETGGVVERLTQEVEEVNIPYNLDNGSLLKYKTVDGTYGLLGRWFKRDNKDCTNNDGSEIYFRTKEATSITVDLREITALTVTPYFAYSIDGGAFVRQQISNKTITVTSGEHVIRVVVDGMTEVETGASKWQGTNGIYIEEISVNSGTLKAILPVNRIGMFFGDSITEGINALGTGANSGVNSAVNAFPFFCCEKLGAVSYRVGYGGTGVVVSGSFHKFGDAITNYNSANETGYDLVDFIVINHGVNDSMNATPVPAEDFITEYAQDIDLLRKRYGAIPIFCVTPFRNQAYSQEIKTMCDGYSNCYYISSQDWGGATVDGTHLSADGARNNGNILADKILKILGKAFFMN